MKRQKQVFLSFWGQGIDVSSNDRSLLVRIAERFGPFLVSSSPPDSTRVIFEQHATGDTHVSVGERKAIVSFDGRWPDPTDVIKILVVQAHPGRLFIHASCVSRGAEGIALAGPSTSGKTTLAVSMASKGWTILADDLVPLDVRRRSVLPFPTSPTLRPFTANLLSQNKTEDPLPEHMDHEVPLKALFLLNHETVGKKTVRDVSSQFGRWATLMDICCGPTIRPNARSAKTLISHSPDDFVLSPSISKASHAFALREIMSLTHPPPSSFCETLAAVSDFVNEVPIYHLKGGQLDSTVELILKTAGC